MYCGRKWGKIEDINQEIEVDEDLNVNMEVLNGVGFRIPDPVGVTYL